MRGGLRPLVRGQKREPWEHGAAGRADSDWLARKRIPGELAVDLDQFDRPGCPDIAERMDSQKFMRKPPGLYPSNVHGYACRVTLQTAVFLVLVM
jgi:hypothetical protein